MLISSAEIKALQKLTDQPWFVGFSGGADSTALLHFLSTHFPQQTITAIHVNHQLSPHADDWELSCANMATTLNVGFVSERVTVAQGDGLEAEARKARYRVFDCLLAGGGCLMLGHHLDDQAETFLFRALRGESLAGLAAIPKFRTISSGILYRPLLSVSRTEIEDYLQDKGLGFIQDESNSDLTIKRNYLRHALIPDILHHEPNAAAAFARSAECLRDSLSFQDELLAERRNELAGRDRWGQWIERLEKVSDQKPWLNSWFRSLNVAVTARQLNQIADFFTLGPQSKGTVLLSGQRKICWSGKRIYLVNDTSSSSAEFAGPFKWAGQSYDLVPQAGGMILGDYVITRLDLSLRLALVGRNGTKSVNKWLKEQGVPWFARENLPAVMDGPNLVAVADLLISKDYNRALSEQGVMIQLVGF